MKYFVLLSLLSIASLTAAEVVKPVAGSIKEAPAAKKKPAVARKEAQITPPAGPKVRSGANFFMTGAFIYWNARQEGLSFAEDGHAFASNVPPPGPPSFSRGGVTNMKFQYMPGFKIGGGLNFFRDGWDLYFNYTWLSPQTHHVSTSVDVSEGHLRSLWIVPIFQNANPFYLPLFSASEEWELRFNALDAELGRSFFISPKLTLRPHMGFKAGWVKQEVDVDYGVIPTEISPSPQNPSRVVLNMRQRMFGFGIRGGLNTSFILMKHWSLYGDFSLAELLCKFTERRKDHTTVNNTEFVTYNIGDSFHNLEMVIEFGLGLKYSCDFKRGKKRLDIQAGWEEQIWFNQNQLISPIKEHAGNLTMNGLTAKVGFAF